MARTTSLPSFERPLQPASASRSEVQPPAALVEAMAAHLRANRPSSGNEALRLLRAAFPYVPLADRVRAADEARRG